MRLPQATSDGVCLPPLDELEVLIQVRWRGYVISSHTLPLAVFGSMIPSMPSPIHSGGAKAAPVERDTLHPLPDTGPVAGTITPKETELAATVREWLERNAKDWSPGTLKGYRGAVNQAIRECGWSRCSHVTLTNVTTYLDSKRASGEWVGSTYNRQLGAFKSLTKFMAMREKVAKNPLEHADGVSQRDSGKGARAATTEEIRALVKLAWARESTDKRAKGNRAIHRAMLALGGMRYEEPFLFRWRNYRRTDKVLLFWWEKSMQKCGREDFIVVAPELVKILEEHRSRLLASGITETITIDRRNGTREVRPCDPNDPDAFILPYTSSTSRFSKDAEACEIQRHDWRGQRFSSHAFRKWFETTLIDAGVQQRQVDFLMRHRTDVASRYYDATPDAQLSALSRLPSIWPGGYSDSSGVASAKKVHLDSTSHLTNPTNESILTALIDALPTHSDSPNGEVSISPDEPCRSACGSATRGIVDAGASPPRPKCPPKVESDKGYLQTHPGPTRLSREALADILDAGARFTQGPAGDLMVALARLLREPGSVHERQANRTA